MMVDEVAKGLGEGIPAPIALAVSVEILPDRMDDFWTAIKIDAEGSRLEPGCLRFDVIRDQENPNKFMFYEVY